MNKVVCRILPVLAIALVIAMVSGVASAQDVFWTNYFSNNVTAAPDATLRITNPGVQAGNKGTFSKPGPGSLCAMIYVHSADQQMNECCGCLVTPNGLQTADVKTNLTSNPLTFRIPVDGVIQIISAALNSTSSATAVTGDNSPFCDPSAAYTPTPDLRAWVTHIQNKVGTAYPETETASLEAPLSASEQGWEQAACDFAIVQGSGQGICDCGPFEK
jgi:hypothetical protein